MFDWIKKYFNKKKPTKKVVGGFEVVDGIVLGPGYFSTDGKQSSALTCPAIWAFNFGISNTLNKCSVASTSPDEFQGLFNSVLDDIIADCLIYFQNRLRTITVKDKLKFKMNSIPECIKAYKQLTNINLENFCDINFLKKVDRLRGDKHHTFKRYDHNYEIDNYKYDDSTKLKKLTDKVKIDIQELDKKLSENYIDYKIKVSKSSDAVEVEWTAVNHALDMTNGGKIVEQKGTQGLDKTQIKFFAIKINYKK